MKYRICTECEIHHVENCETCFGFGVYEGGLPVSADDAHYGTYGMEVYKCPECGSTEKGA